MGYAVEPSKYTSPTRRHCGDTVDRDTSTLRMQVFGTVSLLQVSFKSKKLDKKAVYNMNLSSSEYIGKPDRFYVAKSFGFM